jgi:hypothetical protein
VTFASNGYSHSYPFSPALGDFPGTDQIYVGQMQSAMRDGYSAVAGRINGPDVITMDYSSLLSAGQSAGTLTLGIAADDFQYPVFGDPIAVTVNGVPDTAIANALMSRDMEITGVNAGYEQFLSVGVSPSDLLPSNILTLSINEGGDGGDGWAVDFLTIGVTPVPEPACLAVSFIAGLCLLRPARNQAICRVGSFGRIHCPADLGTVRETVIN